MAEKVQPISFRKVIPPLAKGYIDYVVPDSGTIEGLRLYFAQGQTFDLHVWPVILQSGSDLPTDIILAAEGTDKYLSGDNITLEYKCSRPLTPYDKLRINYESVDASNSMNLSVDVTIDYYAGKVRVS